MGVELALEYGREQRLPLRPTYPLDSPKTPSYTPMGPHAFSNISAVTEDDRMGMGIVRSVPFTMRSSEP